jgi:N-acetylmuramoyl-L-alanine amidase
LTLSPNPLNFSIKDKTDNVNPIGCQVKLCHQPPNWIEKPERILYKKAMFSFNTPFPYLKISHAQKNRMCKCNGYVSGCYLTAVMLFSLLFFSLSSNVGAKQALFEADLPVVVIDPGHGGNDTGSEGPDGNQEKAITLTLARLVADQLKSSCRVVLTRSDDYRLDISGRTAVANQSKADVFISLHTGGSFSRSISGSTVYYHRRFIESALTAQPKVPKSLTDSSQSVSWDQIQTKYRVTSEKLAKLIQDRLNRVRRPPDTKVQGAPLLVLEGADMPAVAIEIGNLSNPNEEKKMRDPAFLAGFARSIADGIDAFLSAKPQ